MGEQLKIPITQEDSLPQPVEVTDANFGDYVMSLPDEAFDRFSPQPVETLYRDKLHVLVREAGAAAIGLRADINTPLPNVNAKLAAKRDAARGRLGLPPLAESQREPVTPVGVVLRSAEAKLDEIRLARGLQTSSMRKFK